MAMRIFKYLFLHKQKYSISNVDTSKSTPGLNIIPPNHSCKIVQSALEGRHDLPIQNIWESTPKTFINLGVISLKR